MAKSKKPKSNVIELKPEQSLLHRSPDELKPYLGNARKHDEKQLAALMASIREFGFTTVIITNEDGMVLAGHGRLEAAKRLGLATVPTRVIEGLTKAQQRAYVLADNKTSLMSTWDHEQLRLELDQLVLDDFNIELTGFSTAEFDLMFDVESPEQDDADDVQPKDIVEKAVSREGDLYHLGKHRLYCGSCLDSESYAALMDGDVAQMVITDPPYNVKISGHVMGKLLPQERSANMRKIRSKGMKPEMAVRKLVYSLGYRYRLHGKGIPGKPDLVFASRKKIIFVNGCFWHQHDSKSCKITRVPKSNLDFWRPKLERTKQRDREHLRRLRNLGWQTMVIWECQLKNIEALKGKIIAFLS